MFGFTFNLKTSLLVGLLVLNPVVFAEQHLVRLVNNCGHGTPTLVQGPNVLSTGGEYLHQGPLMSFISYLQTGECSHDGIKCTVVEGTLVNPDRTRPGSGSSADITLIAPLAYNVKASFRYINGCDEGAVCGDPKCKTAFFAPMDTWVQVACQKDDAGLEIIYC